MPAYAWTCSACGHANAAMDETCPMCRCSAVAGFREIEAARKRHESAGGAVLPGAALFADQEDRALFWNLFAPTLKVLAWIGFGIIATPPPMEACRRIDRHKPPDL